MKLHEIESEITLLGARLEDWAAEHEGDVTEFPFISEMEGLSIERERKMLSMACLVKEIDSDVDALKKEIATLSERARVKSNAVSRIKGVLSVFVEPGEKLSDERVALSWRKSESVEVEVEPEELPEKFRRVVTSVNADKAALKEAIKGGETVEGVRIVSKMNLQIK